MTTEEPDPTIQRLREEISENDRRLVEALNRRLELVGELKAHKDAHGIAFVDPERERRLLDELARANRGPLHDEELRRIFREILELTKREVR